MVRGPYVTVGYWVEPGRIDDATRDGWYHSGDLMRQGEGDELWFMGRKKDIIIRGDLLAIAEDAVTPLTVCH
jgi:long-subunit acyl-CoA synthetase (AMP-forming)